MRCELCGGAMVIRSGRYGSFYACANYPTCRHTKPMVRATGVACPLCGAQIVTKRAKNKSVFYSCESYPTCSFSSWDMPLAQTCPKCNSMLLRKKGKNLIVCSQKDCDYRAETESGEHEEA
jgi:DNA topoisomerase-1